MGEAGASAVTEPPTTSPPPPPPPSPSPPTLCGAQYSSVLAASEAPISAKSPSDTHSIDISLSSNDVTAAECRATQRHAAELKEEIPHVVHGSQSLDQERDADKQ